MTEDTQRIPLTEEDLASIVARGISPEQVVALGWQSCAGNKRGFIAIPYYRKGVEVGVKYRTFGKDKKFFQQKGSEQCLYNLAAIEDLSAMPYSEQAATTIVITEGEPDAVIALQCGYLAVSVPNGAPDKPIESEESTKFDYLADMPKNCIVVLAVDSDQAGQNLKNELALRLGWHRCKTIKYPKGCKDLNDVYMKYGQKGVRVCFEEKTSFFNVSGIMRLDEIPAQSILPVYDNHIDGISDKVKMRPGDIWLITGIPTMGKTLFTNCLIASLVEAYGWQITIASFENNIRDSLLPYFQKFYLSSYRSSMSFDPNEAYTDSELEYANKWVNDHMTFIVADVESDEMTTLAWVLDRMKAAVVQYGARVLVIDPWNEIDHDRPNGMNLTEYVGFAIKEMKRFAKRYMVNVIIVAHPSKPEKNKDGEYNIPSLYDVSDSSHWYNKFDVGIIVHRHTDNVTNEHVTQVRVSKLKDWERLGRPGDYFLSYSPPTGRYEFLLEAPDFAKKTKRPAEKKPKKEKDDKKKDDAQPEFRDFYNPESDREQQSQ